MTIGESTSYDVTPTATVREIAQMAERIMLLETQVAQLQMCARSQRYADEDCVDIGGAGLTD